MVVESDGAALASGEASIACRDALALIRRFVTGDEDVQQRDSLRAHLVRCGVCRDQYRAEVMTLARIARAPELVLPRRTGVPIASGVQATKPARGRRLSATKLLLPAFGLCALWAIAERGPDAGDVRIRSLGGEVRAAAAILRAGEEPLPLMRGSTCSTSNDARARLEGPGGSIVLEPSAALMVERSGPLRVRLFAGSILIDGSAIVTTASGVIEVEDGRAAVRIGPEELLVACGRGACKLTDPRGDREVAVERTVRIAAARGAFAR